jgi:signal peptidase I
VRSVAKLYWMENRAGYGEGIHLRNGIVYRNGVAQNEPKAAKPNNGDGNPNDAYIGQRDLGPTVREPHN